MLKALGAALIIAAILQVSAYLHHRKILKGELSRKFAHIACGCFIAFLPFWLPYRWIAVLAVGFIIVNAFGHYFYRLDKHLHRLPSRKLRRLVSAFMLASGTRAIHSVARRSWGEVLYGVAILLCALVRPDPWLFAAAILMVALADGLAAVVGVTLGVKHGYVYKVFGYPKTFLGTWTFILAAFCVLSMVLLADPGFVSPMDMWPILIWTPVLLAMVENIGVYGLDNLLLPIITLALLNAFRF